MIYACDACGGLVKRVLIGGNYTANYLECLKCTKRFPLPEEEKERPPDLPPSLPSAPDLCRRAADLMAERGRQYDKEDGERDMKRAVEAFNTITGQDMTEPEGWLFMQVLKDVRQWTRPGKYHADSAEDCIAYAALKAESLARDWQ